ncbi:uncharacterized protein E0L32_000984 [Thyridium curvatum]|uniref:Uncharacterized protein n=1 Tax=Thyridium curvatum TaxID=1093900 RepID=A0A507AWP9_9PEZI|nr:uncharacterized protein E0L32_000984 [Thyridium curvatum]TPX11166.1 hypothetical protein E0L32_000984 [Thyridium curvatum]
MGTPTLVAPSSEAELRALRRKSARALWELVPRRVGRLYFGGALSGFTPRSGPSTSGGGGGGQQGQASSPAQASEADDHRPRPPQDRRDDATTTSAATYGDDSDGRILDDIERDVLDPFSDAYCNKHLMYSVLELILVRLMPELAERRVTELWEERLS